MQSRKRDRRKPSGVREQIPHRALTLPAQWKWSEIQLDKGTTMKAEKCVDCGGELEMGVIPYFVPGRFFAASWHPNSTYRLGFWSRLCGLTHGVKSTKSRCSLFKPAVALNVDS